MNGKPVCKDGEICSIFITLQRRSCDLCTVWMVSLTWAVHVSQCYCEAHVIEHIVLLQDVKI